MCSSALWRCTVTLKEEPHWERGGHSWCPRAPCHGWDNPLAPCLQLSHASSSHHAYLPAPATPRHSPAQCSRGAARLRPGSGSADRKQTFEAPRQHHHKSQPQPAALTALPIAEGPEGLLSEKPPGEVASRTSPGCCAMSLESSRCPGCWRVPPVPLSSAGPSQRCCGDATTVCSLPCCEREAGEATLLRKPHLHQAPLNSREPT